MITTNLQEMKDLKVCCIDSGLFIENAIALSKYFGETYYYTNIVKNHPRLIDAQVGTGYKEITRINDIFLPKGDYDYHDIDAFFFFDNYYAGLQQHLTEQGYNVFGARRGEDLELNRIAAKKYMKKVGIDMNEFTVIKGTDNLREYLKKHNGVVKISYYRGVHETFLCEDYKLIEFKIDEIENNVKTPGKYIVEFLVEDIIDTDIEGGSDNICVDGEFTSKTIYGFEKKDVCYIATWTETDKLAGPIKKVNDALSGALKKYRYRGKLATEIKITKDGKSIPIDITCREGTPCSELQQEMIENYGEVYYKVSCGELPELKMKYKYGVQVYMFSDMAVDSSQPIDIPEDIRKYVKLFNCCKYDGYEYILPIGYQMRHIGSVLGFSNDSVDDAIKQCKKHADKITAHGIDIPISGVDSIVEEIQKAKKQGINF